MGLIDFQNELKEKTDAEVEDMHRSSLRYGNEKRPLIENELALRNSKRRDEREEKTLKLAKCSLGIAILAVVVSIIAVIIGKL